MGIQEIGARFVVLGKTEFLAAMRAAKAEVDSLNRSLVASATKAQATALSANPISALADSAMLAQKAQAAETAAQYDKVAKVGKAAFFGLAGAAAVAGYEGLKIHSQFQQAMTQVTTLAGVDQSRIAALTSGIKQLAPAVGQGLVPMANALYRIASAQAGLGATNQQLLNMTRAAGQLATIGGPGTDLEQTARIIGGIKATGVKGAGTPENIVSMAAATVGSGDIRMSDFVDFMGTGVLSSGNLAGVNLKDVATFLALAGDNLQSGSVSGHSLAHGLSLLAAPSGVAEQAFQSIGLGGSQIGDQMRTQGLGPAIQSLVQHLMSPMGSAANAPLLEKYGFTADQVAQAQTVGLGNMGPTGQTLANMVLTRMFGGAKQAIPLDMLITEASRYQAKSVEIGKQMGNFDKAWGKQTQTLSFKAKQFTASIQDLADTIGGDLTPVAKVFLGVGSSIASFFGQNQAAAIALTSVLTGVLGPAIGVYLVKKFTDVGGAIATVVKWYGKLVRAILKQLIPSLFAEDTALATTTAAERVLGTTALTTAGEEATQGRVLGVGALGWAGGAAAAGVTSYAISSALSSHFDTGNASYGTDTAAAAASKMTGQSLVQQYSTLESKLKAAQARMSQLNNQSGISDLFSGDAWLSAITFGAKGKEAEYNQLVGQVAEYKKDIAAIQGQAADQNINLSVNLDGKQLAKSTVKVVRQQTARS